MFLLLCVCIFSRNIRINTGRFYKFSIDFIQLYLAVLVWQSGKRLFQNITKMSYQGAFIFKLYPAKGVWGIRKFWFQKTIPEKGVFKNFNGSEALDGGGAESPHLPLFFRPISLLPMHILPISEFLLPFWIQISQFICCPIFQISFFGPISHLPNAPLRRGGRPKPGTGIWGQN